MSRGRCLGGLALVLALSVVTPALADTYYVYSEGGIPTPSVDNRTTELWTWCDQGQPCAQATEACGGPEGITTLQSLGNLWSGFGFFLNTIGSTAGDPTVDLSAFQGGNLEFWAKPPQGVSQPAYNIKVEIQCNPSGTVESHTVSLEDHGWDGFNFSWQEFSIPLSAFTTDADCYSNVVSPFMVTQENLPFFNTFFVDYVRWTTPTSHSGASAVTVQDRQILVDGEPFIVEGMAYAPIDVGENWQGAWQDRPDRYLVDFPLIAASGANTVRLYAPLLSTPMLDAAWANGLYVIPTFGVAPGQLTCPVGRTNELNNFVDMVNEWKDHPAILTWLVGNEVNTNLGAADLCTDWYTWLDDAAAAAHAAEGTGFHPVGTAVAEMADICASSCSQDADLPNVDFWATQLYRGCTSIGTAFVDYANKTDCDRPLLVTEFGADSYNSMTDLPDETLQATCLATLLEDVDANTTVRNPSGVSSGHVLFSWTDEWWKADEVCGTGWDMHDGCISFNNFAYPDPGINEEWWGIAAISDSDPNARTLRAGHTEVSNSWNLGSVCNLEVISHDSGTGDTTFSFAPAPGSTDHTVYFGPLSSVSSYGYSGSVTEIGATGSGSATLPGGSLFWLVAGRDQVAEGSYGEGAVERPASPGAAVPQSANRTDICSAP